MPRTTRKGSATTERLAALEELGAFLADLPDGGHAVALEDAVSWPLVVNLCRKAAAERSERLVTYPSRRWPLMDARGFAARLRHAFPRGKALVLVRAGDVLRRRPIGFHLENEHCFERLGSRRPRIVCVYDPSVLKALAPREILWVAHNHRYLHPAARR